MWELCSDEREPCGGNGAIAQVGIKVGISVFIVVSMFMWMLSFRQN